MSLTWIKIAGLPVMAYLLGSVPFGLLLTRSFTGIDIRKSGSGNIGATNVRRSAGNFLGSLTLAGDLLKGLIPVWLASGLDMPDFYTGLIALASIGGHIHPVFLGFRGGKGVATAAGAFLAISPAAILGAVAVFILTIFITRRVSAGSLAGTAILPPAIWYFTGSAGSGVCAAIAALWIWFRHRENIRRLRSGTEPEI